MSRYIIVGKLLYKILAIQQIYATTPNLYLWWSSRNRVPCGLVYLLFSASHTSNLLGPLQSFLLKPEHRLFLAPHTVTPLNQFIFSLSKLWPGQ